MNNQSKKILSMFLKFKNSYIQAAEKTKLRDPEIYKVEKTLLKEIETELKKGNVELASYLLGYFTGKVDEHEQRVKISNITYNIIQGKDDKIFKTELAKLQKLADPSSVHVLHGYENHIDNILEEIKSACEEFFQEIWNDDPQENPYEECSNFVENKLNIELEVDDEKIKDYTYLFSYKNVDFFVMDTNEVYYK